MALTPKFQAVIKVWETVASQINIEFARPMDRDVLQELKGIEKYSGFRVSAMPTINYLTITLPSSGVYDLYDVAREVEDILRRHQFENLKFIINSSKACGQELTTMAEVK